MTNSKTPKNKFGTLKIKILHNLTEAYISGDKKVVKEILGLIKENKKFKELYLFYDEIENMYIEDKEVAKVFVEHIEILLKESTKSLSEYCKIVDEKLKLENLYEVELFQNLDLLTETNNLKNIDKKIIGKNELVEFLTTKKDLPESMKDHTVNENLLHVVLANQFNSEFENTLSEDEKKELQQILTITKESLETNINVLKEDIRTKISDLMTEESDPKIKERLGAVLVETNRMPITKYNYYKLQQLENGL